MTKLNINKRRKELGLTLAEIGNYVGVAKSTVKKWETGYIGNMKRDKIALLAEILQVSPLLVIGAEGENDSFSPSVSEDYTTFPVLGEIAAGYDSLAVEDWEGETIDIPNSYLKDKPKTDYFVLKIKGDSMYPAYQEGDKVLILKQTTTNYSGQVAVIMYEDTNATLKKVEYTGGESWLKLVPINANYPPIIIEGEKLEHCHILGIPKMLIREMND